MRNRDFYRECRRQLSLAATAGEAVPISTIIERAIYTPAPGYYIDFKYAYRRIAELNACGEVKTKSALRRQMWSEIAQKVKALMDVSSRLTLNNALTRVLADSRSSRYFITPAYAYRLYYSLSHQRRSTRLRSRSLF